MNCNYNFCHLDQIEANGGTPIFFWIREEPQLIINTCMYEKKNRSLPKFSTFIKTNK